MVGTTRRSRPLISLLPVFFLWTCVAGCVAEQQDEVRPFLPVTRVPPLPRFEFEADGVHAPALLEAAEVELPDEALVIGVRVGESERAYVVEAFEVGSVSIPVQPDGTITNPDWDATPFGRHVVNDVVDGTPVTVTYCDRDQCTRVLTAASGEPLQLGVGGWDDGMLLLIDGQRVPQRSEDLPLEDLPFEVTTWGEWRERYPESDVYVGG